MRRVNRQDLPAPAQRYLDGRQVHADHLRASHRLEVEKHWNGSRQTLRMGAVLQTLQGMAGPRQRCMYCLDSQGSDIEHFRPKAAWPQYMYRWENLLLSCTYCGRLKGSHFPMRGRKAHLLDPTKDNPWNHLNFDPVTGNLSALFDLKRNDWSIKGLETVRVLQLDRRESLSCGYLKTFRRLSDVIDAALTQTPMDSDHLLMQLSAEDDHGLLGWCFTRRGALFPPFSHLFAHHANVWRHCQRTLSRQVS